MSRRPRTATRGWRSKRRRKLRAKNELLERKARKKVFNEHEERELQYHLNEGN